MVDGVHLNKSVLQSSHDLPKKSDLHPLHKLTNNHINVQGTFKQKVKLAAQLMSNTVAKGLQFYGDFLTTALMLDIL